MALSFVLAIKGVDFAYTRLGTSSQNSLVAGACMLVPVWGLLGKLVGLRSAQSLLIGVCGALPLLLFVATVSFLGVLGVSFSVVVPLLAIVWLIGHHPPLANK